MVLTTVRRNVRGSSVRVIWGKQRSPTMIALRDVFDAFEVETMNSLFSDPAAWSRIQFAFTIIYHYLFPQLTMGLAWFLVYWKWRALRTGDEKYIQAARLWAKIFGLNFAVGVVTGIPMEFQFGTNWAGFSKYAGGVVGHTLAMEGMVAFFLESAFIGALIWGEKRLGPRLHFVAAVPVPIGSWISG